MVRPGQKGLQPEGIRNKGRLSTRTDDYSHSQTREDRWDDPWLIIRAPIIAPFISFTMADKGGYAGLKSFEVSQRNKHYYWWLNKDEIPPRGKSFVYFTPEAAIRTKRYTEQEYTPGDPLVSTHIPSWLPDLPPWQRP